MSEAGLQWVTPVILAIWEAEIGRLVVQGQPRQVVCKTHLLNNQSKMEWRSGSSNRVSALQAWSPEFKSPVRCDGNAFFWIEGQHSGLCKRYLCAKFGWGQPVSKNWSITPYSTDYKNVWPVMGPQVSVEWKNNVLSCSSTVRM
jgi:hypothetical protein